MTAAAARAAHLVVDGEPVIFADTLALALLGERAEELLSYHTSHGTHPVLAGARAQVTCRSRYTEDALARAAGSGVTQYVILGAGLDSFAYRSGGAGRRTPGPGVRGRSSGYPGLEAPRARARPGHRAGRGHVRPGRPGRRTRCRASSPRRASTAPAPALVSWLGVTMYLTGDAIAATLAALGGARAGQRGHRRLHAARGAARRRGRRLRQPRRPGVRRAWRAVAVVPRAG